MAEKEINLVIKIMGILGVIFTLIALLTPWGIDVFTFGIISSGLSSPFYIEFFSNPIYQAIGEFLFFAIAMIIIFIITLIALLMSISSVKNFEKTPTNKFLTLGILLIVDIIIYVIAVSLISSRFGTLATFGAYGIGFVMAIIAAIMFFIVYGIKKMYMPAPAAGLYQQQMYAQPQTYAPQQQPPPPPPAQQPQPQQPVQTNAKKFCSNCGTQLAPNSKFCPNCGNQL